MKMMRQIIYASSAVVEMTPKALDNISAQAQKNNAIDEITGIILYGDQMFFQVLEGPAETMASMKVKIWNDTRHRGITEFKDSEISERSFPDWSMGCYRIKTATINDNQWEIIDLDSITDHLPSSVAPDVLVLAQTFYQGISPRGTR